MLDVRVKPLRYFTQSRPVEVRLVCNARRKIEVAALTRTWRLRLRPGGEA
jgi:tartrate dehydratase alpha subunit/fumarate hydratase class I-like protein